MRRRPMKVAVWTMGILFLAATIISCGGEQACTPTGKGDEEASSTPAGEESLVPLALIQRGGGGGGGRGGVGGSRSGGGGSKANNSTPRVNESAPKASAAANVSKPPSRAQSSYKSHPYSSRYHSSNVWMWFFFAMYIAEDDDPDEEEFEGWLEDQDEDDLTAAEQQYTEEVEGC
ncbi:MAG TPA: hypothetical protein VHF70_10875 [Rubrobacteraceae bacterium]|jgi:hypothetical protein|nr:hypothetical protein [Rubrobacteraceae bacterium]